MKTEDEIIELIKTYVSENNKSPTIHVFCEKHSLSPSSVIRKFGSWNELLRKAGTKLNKAEKRTDHQLLGWLKSHPDARYNEIPLGIRNRLDKKYESISEARKAAGLLVTDWRTSTKKRNYKKPDNVGRPIEFTEEKIINSLRELAGKLGKPPKVKDITKKNCGFTITTVLSRFGSLNKALQAASLPIVYSAQEQHNLLKEFEILMVNIKIALKDIPISFSIETKKLKPTFVYEDRCEDIKLKRSDIFINPNQWIKYNETFGKTNVWYLVDDSLDEIDSVKTICIMELVKEVKKTNESLAEKIIALREKYDEISRKYIGKIIINKTGDSWFQ